VCPRRLELILDVGIEVPRPILFPDLSGRERHHLLKEKKEGGEGVLLHLFPCPATPFPGFSVERPNRLLRENRHQPLGLTPTVLCISGVQVRIFMDIGSGYGVWLSGPGIALKYRHRVRWPQCTKVPPIRGGPARGCVCSLGSLN
jgi:hypothetical protein